MKKEHTHTNEYYEAKKSRNFVRFFGAVFASTFGYMLAWHFGLLDKNVVRIFADIILALGLGVSMIFLRLYLKARKDQQYNLRLIDSLRNYGTKIPCKVESIDRKGSLSIYTIVFSGYDHTGEKHTFSSDEMYKDPSYYISVGDDVSVYIDRETGSYHIEYPESFPQDSRGFYIY